MKFLASLFLFTFFLSFGSHAQFYPSELVTNTSSQPNALRYILFQNGNEFFLVHDKGFSQILKIQIKLDDSLENWIKSESAHIVFISESKTDTPLKVKDVKRFQIKDTIYSGEFTVLDEIYLDSSK